MDWGELDCLVVDARPATSDEHITITQCLGASEADGAVIVTTPQVRVRCWAVWSREVRDAFPL